MSNNIFIGKYEYKLFGGASWIKIYYQDVDISNYTDVNQALASNEPGKFSILSEAKNLEHYHRDAYEFLLEYPGYTGFNRWKQSNYPLDTIESVSGFVNVSCSWTVNCWRGLSRTSYKCALLDGTGPGCGWFYAFGMKIKCDPAYTRLFPGPTGYRSKVYLWMRVSHIKGTLSLNNCHKHKILFLISLLMIIYLS